MNELQSKYLLVGAGQASVWAAQTIREHDSEGTITIVGREPHPPYDHPPLSKGMLTDDSMVADDAYAKLDTFHADNRIRLIAATDVTAIDRVEQMAALSDGRTIHFERLLIATGSTPRVVTLPGSDLRGVYTLHTLDQSLDLRIALQHAKRAVLIGAGFIGMEVASACVTRGLQTTIVEREATPLARFAGPALAGYLRNLYELRGVTFVMQDEVTEFVGNGSLSAVQTHGGRTIQADLAVVGLGVTLNTELAVAAELDTHPQQGVHVDEYLQTSDPNIWVAGDIAYFNDVAMQMEWHAEHHLNAKWQGRAAGANMAGAHEPYNRVPYFFSDMLDISVIMRGFAPPRSDTRVIGDAAAGEFVELSANDEGTLRMGIGVSHSEPKLDPISDKLEELIAARVRMSDIDEGMLALGPA